MSAIQPFRIEIPESEIDELKVRLKKARWPDAETPDDWTQGVPLAYAQEVVGYWLNNYDWRTTEATLNKFPQYMTNIEGVDIHFLHIESPHDTAKPIIITHGWPGTVLEFYKVIEPLVDPTAHGGNPQDAFHVVCPSLPGYGFSGKPTEPGWGIEKIADVWDQLMVRLGYDSYWAQGGDWGAAVTTMIGAQNKGNCKAIHLNMPIGSPPKEALENPTEADQRAFAALQYYQEWDSGYSKQQSTRPQTVGYGLVDSPVGQAMWILEKFWSWTDCDGHPENALSKDEMLGNIMIYWLTSTAASSARLYWESFGQFGEEGEQVKVPTGCSMFPKEILPTARTWAEQRYSKIFYWNELDKGGHFAAFEQPELFVNELRTCFREMR